jgi:hypothetical protein
LTNCPYSNNITDKALFLLVFPGFLGKFQEIPDAGCPGGAQKVLWDDKGRLFMKKGFFWAAMLSMALALGLVLIGCGDPGGGPGNDGSGSEQTGGTGNNGGTDDSGDTDDNNGAGNNGSADGIADDSDDTDDDDDTASQAAFTPPTKAEIQTFLENHRTNTANKIAGEQAAVYIRSITLNTYTIGGKSITTKPAAVAENAEVKVKFTLRTNLSFNQLTVGERLNIDNYRIDLMSDLQSWLKQQGFENVPSANITTGNTTFG